MQQKRNRRAWAALRESFIRRRLAGESVSLRKFAEEHGISERLVEKHASSENWISAVSDRHLERLDAVQAHSARVVQRIQQAEGFGEAAIRQEHGALFRLLNDIATKKLATLTENDLTTADAIAILRYAPGSMRALLGFPDPVTKLTGGRQQAAKYAFAEQDARQKDARQRENFFERFEQQRLDRQKAAPALQKLIEKVEAETKFSTR